MHNQRLFTSESVTEGHPDKVNLAATLRDAAGLGQRRDEQVAA